MVDGRRSMVGGRWSMVDRSRGDRLRVVVGIPDRPGASPGRLSSQSNDAPAASRTSAATSLATFAALVSSQKGFSNRSP
jgi:hypothetical protein